MNNVRFENSFGINFAFCSRTLEITIRRKNILHAYRLVRLSLTNLQCQTKVRTKRHSIFNRDERHGFVVVPNPKSQSLYLKLNFSPDSFAYTQ